MPNSGEQVPPRKALDFTQGTEDGVYNTQFPLSLCFGTVVNGGMLMAFISKAATHLVSRTKSTSKHRHVRHVSVTFMRPVLPAPKVVTLKTLVIGSNHISVTVHVQLEQSGKLCIGGYIILTDLLATGNISFNTGWRNLPPITPASLSALELDEDQRWISADIPITQTKIRKPLSYIKFFLPITRPSMNIIDQWITPNWKDSDSQPVWTNDLLHFAIDCTLPALACMIQSRTSPHSFYDHLIRRGYQIRHARFQGQEEVEMVGEGLADEDLTPLIQSTMAISTEIKKPLPEQGAKWLFLRVTCKSIVDDRMDTDVVVLDETGDLVALSQHVVNILQMAKRLPPKKAVL